jgi:hypothetical protein
VYADGPEWPEEIQMGNTSSWHMFGGSFLCLWILSGTKQTETGWPTSEG